MFSRSGNLPVFKVISKFLFLSLRFSPFFPETPFILFFSMHVFSYNFFLGFVTCCVHLPYHEHSFRVWDLSLCYSFLSQGSTVLISSVFYFKTSMFLGFTGMFLGFTGMFLGFTSLCCSNLTGLSLFPHLSSDFYKAKFLKVESWQRVHKFKCFVTYSEIIFPHSCTGLNCHQYCEPIKLKKKKKKLLN